MADATATDTAAVETSDDSTPTADETATVETANQPEVRDPAKLLSAYEAEKGKRREQDAALRELRSEFDALKAKADGKEAEFLAAQENQRIKDEALSAANQRILKSEVKAAAKGVLADPQDAYKFLDLDSFEVSDDGDVDESAIKKALEDLVASKPYLAAQGKRFQGTADGGARNDASQPSQLTREDMKRMSPEQITEAEAKGQFDDLLGRT
jgi:hypothetical protein